MTVRYNSPPISEVAFSVFFKPLKDFKIPHFGLFWSEIKDQYPHSEHSAPTGRAGVEESPYSLPQCSFSSENYEFVIQIQGDVFSLHWNKNPDTPVYPSFEKVFIKFKIHLEQFNAFLKKESLGQIYADEYGLDYENQIEQSTEDLKDATKIGDFISEWKWGRGKLNALPKPHAVYWHSLYKLGEDQGILHISARNDIRSIDKADIVVLELNASSGADVNSDMKDLDEWFLLAHDQCGIAFNELTCAELQSSTWGREK